MKKHGIIGGGSRIPVPVRNPAPPRPTAPPAPKNNTILIDVGPNTPSTSNISMTHSPSPPKKTPRKKK
jgi:hypothetical protein